MNKTSVLRLVPLVNPWSKATMLQSAGEVLCYQGSGDVLLVGLKEISGQQIASGCRLRRLTQC